MELIGRADLQLDEVTHAMLDDVADLARQINDIRPLSEDVLRQLKDSLLSERVFSSNAIEGNTLTIRETRFILQTRTIYDNRRKREAQEALNLGDAALRKANASVEVQVHPYQVIDQPTWETLLAGGGAKRTWFFRVWFRKNDKIVWYIFFFGKHFWSPLDETIGADGPWVHIMVSEQHPNGDSAVRLDDLPNTPISIRELLVVDKRIIQRRWDRPTSGMVIDSDVKPIDVAKDFFEEVLLRKLV